MISLAKHFFFEGPALFETKITKERPRQKASETERFGLNSAHDEGYV
jgi:hypothetical protein